MYELAPARRLPSNPHAYIEHEVGRELAREILEAYGMAYGAAQAGSRARDEILKVAGPHLGRRFTEAMATQYHI